MRLFSERDAGRALAAGDVWALVGPSEEMLTAGARSSNVILAAPASGTALWADLWTVPSSAGEGRGYDPEVDDGKALPSPLLPLWLEFALEPVRCGGVTTMTALTRICTREGMLKRLIVFAISICGTGWKSYNSLVLSIALQDSYAIAKA